MDWQYPSRFAAMPLIELIYSRSKHAACDSIGNISDSFVRERDWNDNGDISIVWYEPAPLLRYVFLPFDIILIAMAAVDN